MLVGQRNKLTYPLPRTSVDLETFAATNSAKILPHEGAVKHPAPRRTSIPGSHES